MSDVPPPDWAALYLNHREAMYRAAARILRGVDRLDETDDVVMAAMESLMKKPPQDVKIWEAMMVKAAIRRALDLVKSAHVKHASSTELADHYGVNLATLEDDVVEAVDRQRVASAAWNQLMLLDERHRKVLEERIVKDRSRNDVAAELGVTPGRVSQLVKEGLRQIKEALEKEGVTP